MFQDKKKTDASISNSTPLVLYIISASGIAYKGTVNLKLAKVGEMFISDEHWYYAFTWWPDGTPAISENAATESNL